MAYIIFVWIYQMFFYYFLIFQVFLTVFEKEPFSLIFQVFRCCRGKKLDAKFQVVRFCNIAKPSKERNLAPSRTLIEVFEAIFKNKKIVEFDIVAPNLTDKRRNHFNTTDFLGVFVST